VLELGRYAVGETWPDLTLVLDVPAEVGLERSGQRALQAAGAALDAMERRPLDFHRRVRELFRELPAVYPAPVVLIDGARDVDAVFGDLQEALRRAFP
jgi:dTMP kinase